MNAIVSKIFHTGGRNMTVMNVAEAQEKFPELVDLVANKHEDDIIIMIKSIF